MIVVRIGRDKKGFIRQFTIKGHAGYADSGSDIVCAAVSAVAYTAVGALGELTGEGEYTEKDGFMECRISHSVKQESEYTVRVILESMLIGLRQIELRYSNFIRIYEEEV